jgi:superfamily II DNA helicase RecQ
MDSHAPFSAGVAEQGLGKSIVFQVPTLADVPEGG